MRIRLGPMVAASVLAMSLAAPVSAQTDEWYRLQNPPSSVTHSGEYIGPYLAFDLGSGALPASTGPVVDLFCVDFLHGANFSPFLAHVTPLNQDLTGRANFPTKLTEYLEAAWLSSQFAVNSTADWWDIHSTIWALLEGGMPGVPTANPFWLAQAQANYLTVHPEDWSVVHSIRPESYQEFLINTTPEPVSSTLLLGGLLGVGAGWLRRRRNQPEA